MWAALQTVDVKDRAGGGHGTDDDADGAERTQQMEHRRLGVRETLGVLLAFFLLVSLVAYPRETMHVVHTLGIRDIKHLKAIGIKEESNMAASRQRSDAADKTCSDFTRVDFDDDGCMRPYILAIGCQDPSPSIPSTAAPSAHEPSNPAMLSVK